jgi:UMF1 family MFS transporter
MVTLRSVVKRKSLLNFLLGSMFYRDALNALYAFGGVYAALVLDWQTLQIGVFGIVAAIAAAVFTWAAGLADQKFGPKPVIRIAVWTLILVSCIIVGMSRESLFGVPLPAGSALPDIIFYVCGAVIGGAGGAIYAASRTMMVRHTHPDRPAEAFGLFALTGKATAFLAPAGITIFTAMTGNNQLGFLPVIFLFLIGLLLLRWVNKDGDRAEWSA